MTRSAGAGSPERLSSIVTIPPDRRTEWQSLLQGAFSARWGRDYLRPHFFLDYVTHDPGHRSGDLVGLAVDGSLVSTCQVFRRQMIIGGRAYRVDGIGNVGTDPRFQGRGYGSALLRGWLRTRARGDVTFVYAREGELYRRLGWRRLRQQTLVISRNAIARREAGRFRVRPASPRDMPGLSRIYSRFNRADDLPHVARSAAYWDRWVSWKVRVYGLVAEVVVDGARPVGYMLWRRLPRTILVEEYGALPSVRESVYAALLASLAAPRGAATFEVVRPVDSLVQFLTATGVEYEIRRGFHDTGHAIIRNPALRPWLPRLGLWHIDHF